MQPNVNVTTTTNKYLAPAWVDIVLRSNFFFGEILGKTKEFQGAYEEIPVKYQKGVTSVAFNGFDQLPTSQIPVSVSMTFYPTFVATNVAISGTDLSINKTPGQRVNLMKVLMASRAQDAADDIGNLFQADGTANGGKAPNGLANIVDDGSVASTFGGLSRATYSGLNATVTAATANKVSLLQMRTVANSITDDNVAPDLCMADYTTWAYIETLIQSFQRNTYSDFNSMKGGAGFAASGLVWGGLTIYRDKKVASGILYFLNTKFLEFKGLKYWDGESVSLKSETIKGNVYEYNPSNAGKAFTWTGMVKAYNQAAVNGFMILGGQLECSAPFRNGKLTGIAGI